MIEVSIVIPTHNRAGSLVDLLRSLEVQHIPNGEYEIIVVDDGSTDDTQQVMNDYIAKHRNVRCLRQQNMGPSAARDEGVKVATGRWIAFVDDDCIASPGWLQSASANFADSTACIIEGRTVPESGSLGICDRSIGVDQGGNFATCNMIYRKSAIDSVGGFDRGFATYREDTDLGWRVLDKNPGMRALFIRDMLVTHRTGTYSILGLLKRDMRLRRAYHEARMCSRHPARYRAKFAFLRYFNPVTVLIYPLLAALILAFVCLLHNPSLPCILLGGALCVYAYVVTIGLYFEVHGGVPIPVFWRDTRKAVIVLALWWIVLVREMLGGWYAAVRFGTVLL